MEKIKLQPTDIELSRIVYGAWRLSEDPDTSPKHTIRKIETCLELGIDSFDHADIYGDYECEKLFGNALAEAPELKKQIRNVSKCDIMLISEKHPNHRIKYYDTSKNHITKSLEQSLKNLRVDALDLFLVHRPDPFMDVDETATALDECIDSGKTKAVGVSNFSPSSFDLLQSRMKHPLATNQIEMGVLCHTSFLDGTLDQLYQKKITPMAWSPLSGGRLFAQNDADASRVRKVLEIKAKQQGVSIDAVAIAWLLNHPSRIVPILGTNNLDRIRSATKAVEVKLSRLDWFEIWTARSGEEVP